MVTSVNALLKLPKPSPNDTQIIHVRRAYHCDKENRMMRRVEVWKDDQGRYHCGYCHTIVKDVTNTITGNDFLELTR